MTTDKPKQIDRSGALTAADRAIWRAAFVLCVREEPASQARLLLALRSARLTVEAAQIARALIEPDDDGDGRSGWSADLAMARDALGEDA
jgi:hypothetical protein